MKSTKEEEYQIFLTERELNILTSVAGLIEMFMTDPDSGWLSTKILNQYHDEEGNICHKTRQGEILEFKGKEA
jgi:hypothetical protein